jgi:hypothetical protein
MITLKSNSGIVLRVVVVLGLFLASCNSSQSEVSERTTNSSAANSTVRVTSPISRSTKAVAMPSTVQVTTTPETWQRRSDYKERINLLTLTYFNAAMLETIGLTLDQVKENSDPSAIEVQARFAAAIADNQKTFVYVCENSQSKAKVETTVIEGLVIMESWWSQLKQPPFSGPDRSLAEKYGRLFAEACFEDIPAGTQPIARNVNAYEIRFAKVVNKGTPLAANRIGVLSSGDPEQIATACGNEQLVSTPQGGVCWVFTSEQMLAAAQVDSEEATMKDTCWTAMAVVDGPNKAPRVRLNDPLVLADCAAP